MLELKKKEAKYTDSLSIQVGKSVTYLDILLHRVKLLKYFIGNFHSNDAF